MSENDYHAYKSDLPPYKVWMFIGLSLGIPIFINLIAILLLTPKFLLLMKDYRVRYRTPDEYCGT
jgi:AGCS family alanine or glycine:cation symporter